MSFERTQRLGSQMQQSDWYRRSMAPLKLLVSLQLITEPVPLDDLTLSKVKKGLVRLIFLTSVVREALLWRLTLPCLTPFFLIIYKPSMFRYCNEVSL